MRRINKANPLQILIRDLFFGIGINKGIPIDNLNIAVIGVGYVGLPLALALAEKYTTTAFDLNKRRVDDLRSGVDKNREFSKEVLGSSNIIFSHELDEISEANLYIVTVPTPIDNSKNPDLTPIRQACDLVAKVLSKGDTVVFESTVYPGLTEEYCVPLLEQISTLRCGSDFLVGYSPERVNPGDDHHGLKKIAKVVAGSNPEHTEKLAGVYGSIIEAKIHQAPSIKVAEAAKVIENVQRDVNIALINELALIFDKLNINTKDVLEAASTKWNFLNFKPGLVGGHCIGVDPYYLTYKAKIAGHIPEVILSGRRINDSMGEYIANKVVKLLLQNDLNPAQSKVHICGLTFKENCSDIRNSKSFDIIKHLKDYNVNLSYNDPAANDSDLDLINTPMNELEKADALVLCVAHDAYKSFDFTKILNKNAVVIDVKNILDPNQYSQYSYWGL